MTVITLSKLLGTARSIKITKAQKYTWKLCVLRSWLHVSILV